MKKLAWFLSFMILLAALAGTATAQSEQPPAPNDDQVNAVAKQLYCPVCENIPLDVCPTQACAEWRDLIRLKLTEGWNADQIKAYFAQQYGDRVLAAPPARGLNYLVYILPPLAILAGIYILYRVFKSWKRSAPPGADEPPTPIVPGGDEQYIARLEEELKKR